MIGDPLYDAIARRRDKKRAQRPPEPPRPEGVAKYRCVKLIAQEEPASEHDESVLHEVCGRTAEAKPYAPKPWHHERPMVIAGYDWTRDCD